MPRQISETSRSGTPFAEVDQEASGAEDDPPPPGPTPRLRPAAAPNVWRTPGHHDDGAYTQGVAAATRQANQLHRQRCLAGAFLVGRPRSTPSSSVVTSIQSSGTSSSRRAAPAYNPYEKSAMGPGRPVGRWILERGRPRCVYTADGQLPQLPHLNPDIWGARSCHSAQSAPSGDQQRGVAAARSVADADYSAGRCQCNSGSTGDSGHDLVTVSAAGEASPDVPHFAETSQQEGRKSRSFRAPDSHSTAGDSADLLDSMAAGGLAAEASCRAQTSLEHASLSDASRRGVRYSASTRGQYARRVTSSKPGSRTTRTVNFIDPEEDFTVEDIQEILKPLEATERQASRSSRFLLERPTQRPPESAFVSVLDGPPLTAYEKKAVALKAYQASRCRPGASTSLASQDAGRGGVAGPKSRRLPTSAMGGDTKAASAASRDLKSEIRRMKESLLTSAQQAFSPDVWHSCGIETESAKKTDFTVLMSGGLGFGKNPLEDTGEERTDGADD